MKIFQIWDEFGKPKRIRVSGDKILPDVPVQKQKLCPIWGVIGILVLAAMNIPVVSWGCQLLIIASFYRLGERFVNVQNGFLHVLLSIAIGFGWFAGCVAVFFMSIPVVSIVVPFIVMFCALRSC